MVIRNLKALRHKLKSINQNYSFGDSHADVFNVLNSLIFPLVNIFNVTWIGGATAQGLRNPNSKTEALKIFKEKILKIEDKQSKLFFLLGEVDTGFVIWYRSQKYGEKVEEQLNNSLDAFLNFIDWVKEQGFSKIFVISVPLPTIQDGQTFGEVANARKEVRASQLERTQLTLKYNSILKTNADSYKYQFISTDEHLLDSTNGLIKEKFLNKDRTNHHLDEKEYAKVLSKELLKHKIL